MASRTNVNHIHYIACSINRAIMLTFQQFVEWALSFFFLFNWK